VISNGRRRDGMMSTREVDVMDTMDAMSITIIIITDVETHIRARSVAYLMSDICISRIVALAQEHVPMFLESIPQGVALYEFHKQPINETQAVTQNAFPLSAQILVPLYATW
jgi:hypothetical protein